jgi:Txe/YoeB family toxin of Txe-Axe toxin-antitoxin module
MVMLQRKTELKDAIDKSDFTTFNYRTTSRKANSFFTAQKPPRVTFLMSGGDQSDLDDLQDIAEGSAKVNETEVNKYSDDVKNMNNDSDIKNAPQNDKMAKIKEKLKARNEQTKKKINDKLDTATDEAINKISGMPEKMQDSAADAYSDSMDAVGDVFSKVVGVLSNVLGKIGDILKGIFTTVMNGVKTVVSAVTGAVKSIGSIFGGLFGGLFIALPGGQGSGAAKPRLITPDVVVKNTAEASSQALKDVLRVPALQPPPPPGWSSSRRPGLGGMKPGEQALTADPLGSIAENIEKAVDEWQRTVAEEVLSKVLDRIAGTSSFPVEDTVIGAVQKLQSLPSYAEAMYRDDVATATLGDADAGATATIGSGVGPATATIGRVGPIGGRTIPTQAY